MQFYMCCAEWKSINKNLQATCACNYWFAVTFLTNMHVLHACQVLTMLDQVLNFKCLLMFYMYMKKNVNKFA